MASGRMIRHWPVVLMVMVVAIVFVLKMVTYTVQETELAIRLRFGKVVTGSDGAAAVVEPGLHGRWPWETIWRVDRRVRTMEGTIGEVEEVFTADGRNIIVTVYIGWKVAADNAVKFLQSVGTQEGAETALTDLLRSSKGGVIGQYTFSALINPDPDAVKIDEIEAMIKREIADKAHALHGIDIQFVGLNHIGVPGSVTTKVFERMRAEREALAKQIVAEGDADSEQIRADADLQYSQIVAKAKAEEKQIQGEGDAVAAEYYTVFQQEPELARWLQNLEALKTIIDDKTTIILDTNSAPFDLLGPDALKLNNDNATPTD